MNQHQQITEELARQYETMMDADIVGPGSLALSVYRCFAAGRILPISLFHWRKSAA